MRILYEWTIMRLFPFLKLSLPLLELLVLWLAHLSMVLVRGRECNSILVVGVSMPLDPCIPEDHIPFEVLDFRVV